MARGEDGQALSLNLLFERSGNELYYSYGPGNRAPIAEYSGSWLILDGEGGAWDTPRQIKFTLYSRTDGAADLSGIFEVTRRSAGSDPSGWRPASVRPDFRNAASGS
mgnify:CR=1 FL=1